MEMKSWQQKLLWTLDSLASPAGEIKIAIVGVGNRLYADDAIGLEIARYLQSTDLSGRDDRMILVTGPAPESFCGVLRAFKPDLVLLIDAASMGQAGGTIHWLDWDQMDGLKLSSRSYPLQIMASYLTAELGCVVGLLGVQPVLVTLGMMSSSMMPRVMEIGGQLYKLLCLYDAHPSKRVHHARVHHRKRNHYGSENTTKIQPC